MPIYLPPPAWRPGGPDGKGWNRLSIGWQPGAQCALRPTTPATLMESWNTIRARWGNFGSCIREGYNRYDSPDCSDCPVMARNRQPFSLLALADRILIRVHPERGPALVHKPEQGWGSTCRWLTWDELSRLTGWEFGRFHSDRAGVGFWLRDPDGRRGAE